MNGTDRNFGLPFPLSFNNLNTSLLYVKWRKSEYQKVIYYMRICFNSYRFSSYAIFFLLSSRFYICLIFLNLSIMSPFSSCLMLPELNGSLDFCLSSRLDNSWPSSLQIHLLPQTLPSSLARIPIMCTFDHLLRSHFFFSLCVSFWIISISLSPV